MVICGRERKEFQKCQGRWHQDEQIGQLHLRGDKDNDRAKKVLMWIGERPEVLNYLKQMQRVKMIYFVQKSDF